MGLTDTIANLYLQKGAAQAQGQERVGQLYGSLIANLGQIPGQVQQQEQQRQAAQQEQQIRAQQLQMGTIAMQRAQEEQRAQSLLDEAGKQYGTDFDKIAASLNASGVGHLVPAMQKQHAETMESLSKASKAASDADEASANYAGRIGAEAQAIVDAGGPNAIENAAGHIVTRYKAGVDAGAIPRADAVATVGQLDPSQPDTVTGVIKRLVSAPEQRKIQIEAQNANKPLVLGRGATAVSPQTGATVATGQPFEPAPKSLQTKSVLLDGKPAEVVFDPATGNWLGPQGDPIAAERVKPIPPASQQATPGSTGALTDEGVDYAATQYRLTGVMPPMGMGNSQARAAIINRAAAQAKSLGQSPVGAIQKQAAYKADAASLTKMRSMSSSAEAFETKALAQEDIISNLSKQVTRTSFPLINAALQAGRTNITGDENATKLANAIETFSEEYAKIMNGATGSSAAASDSTRAASKRLINAAMSQGTMQGVLDLMKKEMGLTLQGYDATIDHITTRMGGQPPEPVAPTSGGAVEHWVRDKNGKLVKQ